ncbi:uncharacterized protein LOC143039999 [Oratosquilla oratoria]|uniref:uncharacterized protein LOC143039999 n=1 Tax=Oratosquilla oratoria TaxID=337810 RepID=UPI003F76EC66
MHFYATALLIAVFAASAAAVPTGQRVPCAFHCKDASKFAYEVGKRYEYDYTVETTTKLIESFEGDSQVKINAKAKIDVSAPCEYILRLSDVELVGSPRSSELAEALTKVPLRFSFQDGVVDSVCGAEQDSTWVLNFKKGVLSAFQNSMTKSEGEEIVEETDITGKCKTKYNARVEKPATFYYKSKESGSCSLRPDHLANFATSTYMTSSPIQSMPIMRSEQQCEQTFEDGLLKVAECKENHAYQPFPNHNSGTTTETVTRLVFTTTSKASQAGTDFSLKRSPLTFHSMQPQETNVQMDKVVNILEQLEASSHDQVEPQLPALFYELVASLKGLTYTQINTLLTNTKDINKHKFLVDAIPLLVTPASAQIIPDMINKGDITKKDADAWYTSLALVKNPDSAIFDALATMGTTPSKQAMLGVSALINNYCKKNSACEKEVGIVKLLRLIESQLGSACRAFTEEEKERVVVALKALGNAGRWINAASVLKQCYTEEDNDMEIRVAALEAWRHVPCDYDRSNLMNIFIDVQQDPEVRIASYLALMTCPNKETTDIVKDRLNSEAVNQVSSFVWTHMTNLYESAAPGKLWMHDLIGQDLLKHKFNTSTLKFSRNFESSFFTNELNAGATVESNVIFSGKSFLPRSAMLNLTVDLFGQSINFFEVGGRFEGFEAYVERFFGPNGYYTEETVAAILKNLRQEKQKEQATTIEAILDHMTDEPSGSLYMRLFGNEMYYKHFHGLADLFKSSDYSNPMDLLMDLARKGDIDYMKSLSIIDTEFSVPSISGLPVTLKLNGTATVGLKMSGTFQPRSLKNVNIQGHIQPSAAIQMASSLHVDAFVARSGVKMVSTLHTSTAIDGKVVIQGGNLVDVAFNMPKDKVEILNVNNQFFYYEQQHEVPAITQENKLEACTGAISLLGVQFCGSVSYPLSNSLLSGPVSARVFAEKTDSHSSYVLRFKREKNAISLLIDTPNSKIDRKISFLLSRQENALDASIYTPFKAITAHGNYKLASGEKSLQLDLTIDQTDKYTLVSTLTTQRDAMQVQHQPTLVVTSPNGQIFNLKGTILASRKNNKYLTDILITNFTPKPITFHVALDGAGRKMDLQASLVSPLLDASFNGLYHVEDDSFTSNFDLEYACMGKDKHTITHSLLVKRDHHDSSNTYLLDFHLRPSQFPVALLEAKVQTTMASGTMETKVELTRGPNVLTAEHTWNYDRVPDNHTDLKNHLTITCPSRNINLLFSHHYFHDNQVITNDLNIRLTEQLALEQKTHFTFSTLEHDILISAITPTGKISSEISFKKISPEHYKAKMTGMFVGEEVTLEANFKNKSTPSVFDVEIDGHFTGMHRNIIVDTAIFANKDNAKFDLLFNINDRDFTVNAEATFTSLLLDVNFRKHWYLDAKIVPTGDEKSVQVIAFWDKDNDQSKSLHMTGMISPKAILGSFKYPDNEVSLQANMHEDQIQLQAQWAPDHKISSIVKYSLAEEKSLSVSIETPFAGYENQKATASFFVHDTQVTSSITASWSNGQHLTLSFEGNYEGELFTHTLVSQLSFKSSIETYEDAKITFHHQMNDALIKSNLVGNWNDQSLEGNLELAIASTETHMDLTFKSPFTKDFVVSLRHSLQNTDLSTVLEATYDSQVIGTLTTKGHVHISDKHDVSLIFKIDTSTQIIPTVSATVTYTLHESKLALLADMMANEKKIMISINGHQAITQEETSINGDLRVITPFTHPITVALTHNHDMNHFTSDFEMSRFWSTFGTVKLHANGEMTSVNHFQLTSSISSPLVKAKALIDHKLIDTNLDSKVDFAVNADRFLINLDGILDIPSNKAKLNVILESTMEELQDLKFSFDHVNDGHRFESNAMLIKDSASLGIHHIILFTDIFNWDNTFSIDNSYTLKNKQSLIGYHFHHDVEYTWEEKAITSQIDFDMKTDDSQSLIDASVNINTPFTNDIKILLHHQQTQHEFKPTLTVEYEPGKKIMTSFILKTEEDSAFFEINLDTPFFVPVRFQTNLALQERKSLMTSLEWGEKQIALTLEGTVIDTKVQGLIKVDTTYLQYPLLIEGAYDVLSDVKTLSLVFTSKDTYKMETAFSGSVKQGDCHFSVQIPFDTINNLSFTTQYNLNDMPYMASATIALDEHAYTLKGKIATDAIHFTVDLDGEKGHFLANWQYDSSLANAKANVDFKSPVTTMDDLQLTLAYDLEKEKSININMKRATQELKLRGELKGERVILEASTPFQGWETLGASLLLSDSAIHALVFKNERKIEITGNAHFKSGKGQVALTVTTPFVSYETIDIQANYHLQGTNIDMSFSSTLGSKQFSIKAKANLEDIMLPDMTLEVITPFDTFNRLGGQAKWNMKNAIKTADIKVFRNDDIYHWTLDVNAESALKGHAVAALITPLPGWTTLNLEAQLDLSTSPYSLVLVMDKEGVKNTYSATFDVQENFVIGHIQTPMPGWEIIDFQANYKTVDSLTTIETQLTKDSDKYHLQASLLMETLNPKFIIDITTPMAHASSIHFGAEADMTKETKEFDLSFKHDSNSYTLNISGKKSYKTANIKITTTTPFSEFSSLHLTALFDFTADLKVAHISLLKVEQNYFSVDVKIKENNFAVDIKTPIHGYENIHVNGDYTKLNMKHSALAYFHKNDSKYAFNAQLDLTDKVLSLSTTSPISGYESMAASGRLGHNHLELDVLKDTTQYQFMLGFNFTPTSASVNLKTPIAVIADVSFNGHYTFNNSNLEATALFQHNGEKFEINSHAAFTPKKSHFDILLTTPFKQWNKLALNIHYNIESQVKKLAVSVEKDTTIRKLSVEANYNMKNGAFRIETPIQGYEVLAANYILDIDHDNKNMQASFSLQKNSQSWNFGAQGHFTIDSLKIEFQTPFEGYNTVLLETHFNISEKTGQATLKFGSYVFTSELSLKQDQSIFKLTTPFDALRLLSLHAKYNWNTDNKEGAVTILHNDNTYQISTALFFSLPNSQITLSASLPFPEFEKVSFNASYDINNKDQLIFTRVVLNEKMYGFSLGALLGDKMAHITTKIETPITGWNLLEFMAKIDLTADDKNLQLLLQKNGDKLIVITGKFIGDDMDFKLRSPLQGLKNLKLSASLNRKKRSLKVKMMKDEQMQGSIVASFNSVKMTLETPFEMARQVSWELSVSKKGKVFLEWRRNDNYLTIDVLPQGNKKSFQVSAKSEFDALQMLNLSGHFYINKLDAYLGAQINEDKASFTATADLNPKMGNVKVDLNSPFQNYEHVTLEIAYNTKQGEYTLESTSSSDFLLKAHISDKLKFKAVIPHHQHNNEVDVVLSPFSGHVTVSTPHDVMSNLDARYQLTFDNIVEATAHVKKGEQELFKFKFQHDTTTNKDDMEVHLYGSQGQHSSLLVHREMYRLITVAFNKDGKELNIMAKGDVEQFPEKANLHINIQDNLFHEEHTMTATFNLDRTSHPKELLIEIVPTQGKLYKIHLAYEIDLNNPGTGNLHVSIVTPLKMLSRFSNISATWDLSNLDAADINVKMGGLVFKGHGKLGLYETDLILSTEREPVVTFFVQWRFAKSGSHHDHMIKFGQENNYVVAKFKGEIISMTNVDMHVTFGVSPLIPDINLDLLWNKNADNSLMGKGSFTVGEYQGQHELVYFERNAQEKTFKFSWKATSNIPDFHDVAFTGSYDFKEKFVIMSEFSHDETKLSFGINFTDLNPEFSHNSAHIHLASLGNIEFSLSHDFRNKAFKSIDAVAEFAGQQSSIHAQWTPSENYRTLNGKIEIKSYFIGSITIQAMYDLHDINNAHAQILYERNEDKSLSLKYVYKQTEDAISAELSFTSHFQVIPSASIVLETHFSDAFTLDLHMHYADSKIDLSFKVNESKATALIETTFESFEKITADLEYKMKPKDKVVTLTYKRGDHEIHMNMDLKIKSKSEFTFKMNLSTPFQFLHKFLIDAQVLDNKATLTYVINEVEYQLNGTVDIKSLKKSSFELTFIFPDKNPITVGASYNVKNFILGTGEKPEKLARLYLQFENHNINFQLKGYRNNQKIFAHLDASSSFDQFQILKTSVDYDLQGQVRHGSLQLQFNEHYFKLDTQMEIKEDGGYYFKGTVEAYDSSVTFGLGFHQQELTLTLGYGPDMEITFSIKPKSQGYKEGFMGKIDLPKQGYHDMEYEVEYGFKNDNQLYVEIEVDIGNDQDIEAHFLYDSEGVEARLSSLLTGQHRLRAKRSLTTTAFFTELGYNEYELKLRGGFPEDAAKRGFVLEGEIFGEKVLIDALFQSQGTKYAEGKFVVETPLTNFRHFGGRFTWTNKNNKVLGQAEIILPSYNIPKIVAQIDLDTNNQIYGHITIDAAGYAFSIKTDLQGSSLSTGYEGSMQITTPFFSFSEIDINSSIKAQDYKSMKADFKIVTPYHSHIFKIKYDIASTQSSASVLVDSSRISQIYMLDIIFVCSSRDACKLQVSLNDNKIIGQYEITDKKLGASLDVHAFFLANKHATFKMESTFNSLENMQGMIMAFVEGKTHKIEGAFKLEEQHIKGNLLLSSDLFEGTRKIDFNVLIPTAPYTKLAFDMTFQAKEAYSFLFSVNLESGILFNAQVDTPVFPKVALTLLLKGATAGITLTTPKGTHEAKASWRMTRRMPADYIFTLDVSSPFLQENYKFKSKMASSPRLFKSHMELTIGAVTHKLEVEVNMKETGGFLNLELVTPLMDIERAIIMANLDLADKIVAALQVTFADKVNKMDILFDKTNKKGMIEVESPFLPNEFIKVETTIDGENIQDLKFKMTLMDVKNTLSGVFKLKSKSNDDISATLKILTPFQGYRKMTFGAIYLKDSSTRVHVFSDSQSPFKFDVDATFGTKDNEFNANVSVQTPIQKFEKIGFSFTIPLNKFHPRLFMQLPDRNYQFDAHYDGNKESKTLSAFLIFDGVYKYGADAKLRTYAPYELGFRAFEGIQKYGFHLRTDSSFLHLVAPSA